MSQKVSSFLENKNKFKEDEPMSSQDTTEINDLRL